MSGADALTCPNGHESSDAVYCSICGVRLDSPALAPEPAPAPEPASASVAVHACPHCAAELDPDTRFCEVCGFDLTKGALLEAPVVRPAEPVDVLPGDVVTVDPAPDAATPSEPEADDETDGAADPNDEATPIVSGTWTAVVTADRTYYDRNGVTDVQFPLAMPARTIELAADQAQPIGRRSRSRGTNPTIDLAGPPEDPAVSHTHASLVPRDDGGLDLVDHGSTNGTFVNEAVDPIPVNEPVALEPGDRLYLGAWTRIDLELETSAP